MVIYFLVSGVSPQVEQYIFEVRSLVWRSRHSYYLLCRLSIADPTGKSGQGNDVFFTERGLDLTIRLIEDIESTLRPRQTVFQFYLYT